MAKATKEERRLQKEQAKAAKAEGRAAAKAAKQEKRAAKPRRKSRKAAEAEPAPEEVPNALPIVFRPRLELVTEPGPVKHLHWEAERARLAQQAREAEAPVEEVPSPTPEPTPEPLREEAAMPLVGRRRTLYTTENGNQVVAYEQDGRRQLAITERRGGELQEVPFSESQVDRVLGSEPQAAAAPLQESAQEASPAAQEEPKRRGFWRRKAAAPATPVQEHVYRPVELVETLPAQVVAVPPPAREEPQVAAWEPSTTLREAPRQVRPARPAAAPRAPRKAAPKPRKAKAPRRKLVHKPARVYPGDNHPVIDIEGIGPVYARKLEKMRITTTGLLNVARPGRIAKKLKVPSKTVRKWQAQAELIKVRGIGPQYAEALARSGVKGIDELKRRAAPDIAKQVAKYLKGLDATVVGQPLTPKRIAQWQRKAKPMRRVKVDLEKLAVPSHGIPPPWLRETTGKKAKKAGRTAARRPKKAGKARRAK